MTSLSLSPPGRLKRPGRGPVALAGAALAVLVVVGIVAPSLALHGWLIGFTFAAGAQLGALALLLIHALTGGRWGEAHRPAMMDLARATPALVVLVLPLIFGAHAAYPWASDPATAGRDVPQFYLNPLGVGLRSLIGLAILSGVAWRLDRGRPGLLEAGLGLCVYAIFMNAAAYDWLLSLTPRFTSSAFGAQVIVGQLLSALCRVVLASDARRDDPSWGDLGALMLTTTLGLSYLILMGLAINWYGDLPVQADWYMSRTLHGWVWLDVVGTLIGAVLPMAALLFAGVRNRPVPLKPVALCSLAGLWIQYVWLVAPVTEALSSLVGAVAALAATALLLAASQVFAKPRDGDRHGG